MVKILTFYIGGQGKQITKNIHRDLRGILIIFIQTTNANINGFIQWNVSK